MDAKLHPRVAGLLGQLRQVGEAQMRGLPVYNDALAVAGVGFRVCGDALVGVVITPWFINAVRLPLRSVPVDWSSVGRKFEQQLPGGTVAFTRSGDETTGQYDAFSLHSPVGAFASQEEAARAADVWLKHFLEPAEASTPPESLECPSRRAFLRGRASGP